MEILKYSNERYAGMYGQEISFKPGMNVILGDNETGKSTMISGIYDTLIMNSKIKKSETKGKEFISRRFPGDDSVGIDGTVCLKLAGKQITVRKEWDQNNDDPRAVLSIENEGPIRGAKAESRLKEMLAYGEGVYDNIVFGRQSNEESVLDWYYGFVNGTKAENEILSAKQQVKDVLSAASGISEEQYLKKLDEKLNQLASNWDFSAKAPRGGRGIRHPHDKNVGQILRAYYNLERRRQDLAEAKSLLNDYENLKSQLDSLQERRKELESKSRELQAYESSAALMSSKQSLEKELDRLELALNNWPELNKELAALTALKREDDERQLRAKKQELQQRIERVNYLADQRKQLLAQASGLADSEQDAKECRRLISSAELAQSTLSSGKLHASIDMQPGFKAVLTMANGDTVNVDTKIEQDIEGYFYIEIPGVGKITVAPQNLDIPALEDEKEEAKTAAAALMKKYGVTDLAGIEDKASQYIRLIKSVDLMGAEMTHILENNDPEKLKAEFENIVINEDICVREGLDVAIEQVAVDGKGLTLTERIAVIDSSLRNYEEDYISISKLRSMVSEKKDEYNELNVKLNALPDLTYTLDEFKLQKRQLEDDLNGSNGSSGINRDIEELIRRIGAKEEAVDNIDLTGIEAEIGELEQEFDHKKQLHGLYSRIREDFLRLKEEEGDNFNEFYRQLNEYLSFLTDGQVRLENGTTLKSKANTLNGKELLSRGTRQAILLAFRLALLKFYYRNEGGVIVLDDMLLDMDPGRRNNSVQLLKKFAEDNQVIFTTCDPAIAGMLGGNLVVLGQNRHI